MDDCRGQPHLRGYLLHYTVLIFFQALHGPAAGAGDEFLRMKDYIISAHHDPHHIQILRKRICLPESSA